MKTSRIILALVPLAFTQAALAQGTEEQRAACGPDAFRLCASSIPNVGKITACLRERRGSLSAACRTVMDASDGGGAKQQTAEAPPPRAKPVPRLAEKPKAPPAPPPRMAKAPEPAQPARTRRTDRVAAAPVATPRPVEQRAATPRVVERASPRRAPGYAQRPARQQVATRRSRGGRGYDADMAEAMYWMRAVTGYSGSFDASSLRSFAGLLQ